ncbi:MAG: RluA family pseudouridine synthase [Prevotella sp.]|nr:RluA family pseudouridine synthase [Prevotella sp.]
MKLHPFSSDIPKPERFTYPFCYEPHPLCLLAAEEVKREIECINPSEGKMFGVLVVEQETGYAFLAAYSGLLEGRNDWPYFVPPVFDAQQPDGHFKRTECEIMQSSNHKQMSQDLQQWLFHQYRLLNARGEVKDLVDIWQEYHRSPRIRRKYPLPPGGTGDCCAPKLLQYAYQHGLKPVCMAEFWWGPSPKSEIRHHEQFYPACRGKCKPVLTWMLQGLEVDPNPEEANFSHLVPEIVFEDETIVVLNKPSGMLSVPGRTENYSVATWAKEHWPGAMPVHRLDMWTSGLMVIAKTEEAYHHLQRQFEQHTVKKKYLAVVEGVPAKEHGIIDLPLLSDPLNRPCQMVDYEYGKRAITEYRVLHTHSSLITPHLSLLALWPHTGRTHQLRMHCAHPDGLGCPIVGDELYGNKSDRLYLQAQAITFIHPQTGRRVHLEIKADFDDNLCRYLNN